MTEDEARRFISPALEGGGRIWADFGAGSGTFTRALASILGAHGKVVAVDRDPVALRSLRALRDDSDTARAEIVIATGDFADPDRIAELQRLTLAGALFGNALHFLADPVGALRRINKYLQPGARVVVIEYDRCVANRWVPYPLPFASLQDVTARAGLTRPEVVARRRSRYQGVMYCALATVAASDCAYGHD